MSLLEWTNLGELAAPNRPPASRAGGISSVQQISGRAGSPADPANGHLSAASRDRSLFENLPFAVTSLDAEGLVVFANRAAVDLTGYAVDEIVGRKFWEDAVHPEDHPSVAAALQSARSGSDAQVTVRFLTRDRGPRAAELYVTRMAEGTEPLIDCVALDATDRHEAEEALQKAEILYRTFQEQSPVGILHLDAAGTVTFENHQFRQIVGEGVEDAWIGRSLMDFERLDERMPVLLAEMFRSGEPFRGETVSYRTRTMGTKRLSVHGSPILHPDDGIVGAVLTVSDHTEERRRQEELVLRNRYSEAESALRKAALSDSTGDALLSEAARIFGECASADRAYVLLSNAAGDCCTDRACWASDHASDPDPVVILPDEIGTVSDLARRNRCLHLSADKSSAPGQFLLRKTGAVESIWLAFFDDRRVAGFIVIERAEQRDGSTSWDDAERRLMEPLALLFETLWSWIQAASRFGHLTQTIDGCLFNLTFDEDGERRYLFVTPQIEALTGRSPSEITAREGNLLSWPNEIVHEDDRRDLDAHDEALRDGRESRITYRVRHNNGEIRWLQERATPEKDTMGDILVSGILTDVTEQKAAEEMLKEAKHQAESANRLKSAFIATMSHEIRTPMGAVNGFAELLTRELIDLERSQQVRLPDQVREFLQSIRESSKKLLVLVNDLFDLSNLESGKIDLQRTSTSLHEIVMRATSKVAVPLSEKSVDLRIDLDPSDPVVVGDPQRIEQVLDILLSNAVKFTDDGWVSVRTHSADEQTVSLEVADSGAGISEEYMARLFEPFAQEDNRLNRRYEGSGLGLSLAKRLLELMDGDVEVESRKGEGSNFRILLPRLESAVVHS